MALVDHCLFCKILRKEVPATVVHEDEHVLAFRDIRPVAPTHVLVIPKSHVESVTTAKDDDVNLLGKLLLGARDVAKELGLGDAGYRLVINNGASVGQSVFHLHVHIVSGRPFAWPPG